MKVGKSADSHGGDGFASALMKYCLILLMLAGCGVMATIFSGVALPLHAADPVPAIYGSGDREIRVYTDYFCGPCRNAESGMENLLAEIVKKRRARVLFIDTPVHRETVLYAKYFIYILKAKPEADFKTVLTFRRVLFEAAEKEISNENELTEYLKTLNIPFSEIDVKPHFKAYSELIRKDRINSTPTIVIVTRNGKTAHGGADEIIKALENIRGRISRKRAR